MDLSKLKRSYEWQVPFGYRPRDIVSAENRDLQIRVLLGGDPHFRRLRESFKNSYLIEVFLSYDRIKILFYAISGERPASNARIYPVPKQQDNAMYYRVQSTAELDSANEEEIKFVTESYPLTYIERNLKVHEIEFLNERENRLPSVESSDSRTLSPEMAAVELLQAISEANEIETPTLEK